MDKNDVIIGGTYRHFKGGIYRIIAIAKDCETLQDTIVYQNVEKGDTWVREADNFCCDVTRNGKTFPRFIKMNSGEWFE